MEQKNQYIKELYSKYLQDAISAKEKETVFQFLQNSTDQELDAFIDDFLNDPALPKDLSTLVPHTDAQFEKVKEKISKATRRIGQPAPTQKLTIQRIVTIAATLILAFSISYYFYRQHQIDNLNPIENVADVNPGTNKATLTLADGSTINLSDDQNGIIIGTESIKYTDGQFVGANDHSPVNTHSPEYLVLTTPKGGKYQIILPDGTKVWLNAASTLKYPSQFSGPDRKVELIGEAFFEVAKNTKQPFIVNSEEQEIKVLGTQFNINAYNDEGNISTTLIEGSVQINTPNSPSNTTILSPGQQSIVTGTNIQVKTVNTSDYTAWKDNLLIFNQQSLRSILTTLGRWYDFQVDNTQIPDVSLSGVIPTDVKLSAVLTLLEETSKVKLKIENIGTTEERRVTIKK